MQDQVSLINKVLANQEYLAEGKINEGSYGEIFRVSRKGDGRVFALKALETSRLQKLKKMHEVVVEAALLRKLAHPGVIRIHEVLERQNYIGIVMELCPYGDLFQLMKTIAKSIELLQKKRRIMVYYLAQVLEALAYLHDQQVIHRDLKPENIVLAEDLKIRIIDFGTARVLSQDLLSPQEQERIRKARESQGTSSPRKSLVGSANYLSPEALRLAYGEKSDVWAFGIIAYKFYFGSLPFEGPTHMEIFRQIAEKEVPLQEAIDADFKQLLEMSLKKDPKERADAQTLKKCRLFKGINFQSIFTSEPPIDRKELVRDMQRSQQSSSSQFLFELALEKKMFFGNFKPRLLTISRLDKRLMMAYRYLPGKQVKHEFQLNLNDFAEEVKGGQFEVVTGDKRYCFRCTKGQDVAQVVNTINSIIRKEYHL